MIHGKYNVVQTSVWEVVVELAEVRPEGSYQCPKN